MESMMIVAMYNQMWSQVVEDNKELKKKNATLQAKIDNLEKENERRSLNERFDRLFALYTSTPAPVSAPVPAPVPVHVKVAAPCPMPADAMPSDEAGTMPFDEAGTIPSDEAGTIPPDDAGTIPAAAAAS
jgi:hypothetical protein